MRETRHVGLYIWGPSGSTHWKGTQYTEIYMEVLGYTLGGAYPYGGTYWRGPIQEMVGLTTWGYTHGGPIHGYMWEDLHQGLLGTPTRYPRQEEQATPPILLFRHHSQQPFLYPSFSLLSWERPVGFSLKFTVNCLCN